ncbi:MAG: IS66 family transposase [Planctomycetota bacterium]
MSEALDLQPLLQEKRSLRWERNHYKSLLDRARAREQLLKQEVQQLNARIRYLEKRLYGRNSEKKTPKSKSNSSTASSSDSEPKRSRGHQPGSPGHGRRDYSHLPVQEEIFGLDETVCPHCGCPYQQDTFLGTEDSELIEVEVRAYRRKARRKKYKKGCQCQELPGIITAPGPSKLIDKGKLGISVWVTLLLEKYLYQRPIHRLLESFKDIEFDMAAGTIGDGLKKLAPLFEPVLQQIIQRNQTERHLHADETRWQVFEFIEGKQSYRWYMWVFVSNSTVVYILNPSRAASVLENHLKVVSVLILSVDRFPSYKSFAKDRKDVVLAFCWTHVRRDFLDTANDFSELEAWAMGWVDSIGEIFHLNNQRVEHEVDSPEFAQADQALREALDAMKQQLESELTQAHLHPERAKRLNSLREHWEGLMVFVDHPWIPMDNSEAERRMRIAALGRKNYYGSGSVASGHFTACLFSIFQTLKLWNVNPRKWLTRYLQACADNRGRVPDDVMRFLPWAMSAEQLAKLQYVPGYEDT